MKKLLLKRLPLISLGVMAYMLTLYAQYHPEWAEAYSRSVYPVMARVVGFLPAQVHFSVSEWLVIWLAVLLLFYVVHSVRKVILSKGMRKILIYRMALGLVATCSAVYFCFTVLGGINYHRYSFLSNTEYRQESYSPDELVRLTKSLAAEMELARAKLSDADLLAQVPDRFDNYAQQAVSSMQQLSRTYPVLEHISYSMPKPVMMSNLMSQAGIHGIFVPFTIESNINTDTPIFSAPSTMTHELAHQSGFMHEDEANFIAYLACKQQDDPMMRYSGLFLAFDHALSALEKSDPTQAAAILSDLHAAVQQDIAHNKHYREQHEGFILKLSRTANDLYLKANNQADGLNSYSGMVNLLLAEQRASSIAEELE